MKKRKSSGQNLAGQGPFLTEVAAVAAGPVTKSRGRLSRTALALLGKGLQDSFDEVRKQEVPERFKLLLRQF